MKTKIALGVGASVTLSELGRRKSKAPDRIGRVIAVSKTGSSYRVRWSDLKTADLVHWTLLQACDEQQPSPSVHK